MSEERDRLHGGAAEGEELLRELGSIAREERAEAADHRRPDPPDDRGAAHDPSDPADLERPLGEAFRAEMTRRLQAELAAPARDRGTEAAAEGRESDQAPSPRGRRRGSRRLRPWLAAAAAAAAAGLAGWWLVPSAVAPRPLPAYTLAWSGGLASERSGPGTGPGVGVPRWGGDAELDVTLRPATAERGPVHAHLFLWRQGELRSWPGPEPEVAPTGAVRARGRLGTPPPAAGEWTILVLLGRSDAPPKSEEILAAAQGEAPAPGWTLLRQRVEIVSVR